MLIIKIFPLCAIWQKISMHYKLSGKAVLSMASCTSISLEPHFRVLYQGLTPNFLQSNCSNKKLPGFLKELWILCDQNPRSKPFTNLLRPHFGVYMARWGLTPNLLLGNKNCGKVNMNMYEFLIVPKVYEEGQFFITWGKDKLEQAFFITSRQKKLKLKGKT